MVSIFTHSEPKQIIAYIRAFLILTCLILSFGSNGQEISPHDSLRIEKQIETAHNVLSKYNYDQAIQFASQSLHESDSLNYKSGLIRSLLILAESYKATAYYSKSLNLFLQAQAEIEKQTDNKDLPRVNYRIGELFYEWGVPEKALTYYNLVLHSEGENFKDDNQLKLLNRIAETHLRLNQYEQSLDKYHEILSIYKKKNNKEQTIVILKKIASIYNQQNKYEDALKYNFDILDINKELQDSANIAVSYNTIGFLYKSLDKLPEALEYFNLALAYNQQLNKNGDNDNYIISNLINIGIITQSLGESRNSIRSFNKALRVVEKNGSNVEIAVVHNYLASIYFNSGNYTEARKNTLEAIDLLNGTENIRMLASNKKRLSDIYQKLGDYKLALETYQQYSIIKDSLLFLSQLNQEKEQYKQYLIEATEKESKLNIIDQEIQALELKNEKVKAEKEKQAIELLLREKELQNISLNNQQLERDKQMQKLLLQQEKIDAQRKDQAITMLEQKRDLQAIELQKNEILEKERQKEIELQKSKLKLQDSELERGKIRQTYLLWTAGLFLIILVLILVGFFIKQRDNKMLQSQFNKINNQKKEIERINEELIQLNEEKNDLISIVAHDLKSPLNQISGILDIIKLTSTDQTREQKEYIDKIFESTKRLRNMVTKILDVNAIESKSLNISFEDANLKSLLLETVDRFVEIARKKNINIQVDIEDNLPLAHIDKGLVSEVYENLLSNAVKYSPLGKSISVRLSTVNNSLRTEFVDQGQGINEKDMKKLFGRYHKLSAKPTAGEDSTGLGLSIVKKYVEAINGKVWCESEEGMGANFIVEFEKS